MTPGQVAGLLAWAGCLVGLTTSATETRFALPLVVIGLAGCTLLVADGRRLPRGTAGRVWVAGTIATFLVTFGAGVSGMQHTATDGAAAAVRVAAGDR